MKKLFFLLNAIKGYIIDTSQSTTAFLGEFAAKNLPPFLYCDRRLFCFLLTTASTKTCSDVNDDSLKYKYSPQILITNNRA